MVNMVKLTDKDAIRAYVSIFVVIIAILIPLVPETSVPLVVADIIVGTAISVIALYFWSKRQSPSDERGTFGLPAGVVRLTLLIIVGIGILMGITFEDISINWTFVAGATTAVFAQVY